MKDSMKFEITLGICGFIFGMIISSYIWPNKIKGYIVVDKEIITCKDTKYFKQEKEMIRCESLKGGKYLITGKFEFLQGVLDK